MFNFFSDQTESNSVPDPEPLFATEKELILYSEESPIKIKVEELAKHLQKIGLGQVKIELTNDHVGIFFRKIKL